MSAYKKAGVEPPIGEVIRGPTVRALMMRDGVREADLIGVISAAKPRLQAAGGAPRQLIVQAVAAEARCSPVPLRS